MKKRALHVMTIAGLAAVAFLIADLVLGYVAIGLLHLHQPYPDADELVGLGRTMFYSVPLVFLLTMAGLALAWRDTRHLRGAGSIRMGMACGGVDALIFTLEALPRPFGQVALALLLPVAIVVVAFWLVRWSGRRRRVATAR
jgi:hypothetical protein